jgi:lipopolysaccharide/colanic/teichoic acid biosynthesis glycosyltransferase
MRAHRTTKRIVDIALVVVSSPLTVPLAVLGAVAVLVRDGRPVFYRQVRCGEGGRRFMLFKLRTMAPGDGAGITSAADPRVTRCGAVLRRLKVDELPQLWNVLRGDMSLVGPRPELPSWVDRFPSDFRRVHSLPAGLTDFASIYFRDEAEVLQRLLAADPAMSLEDAYATVVLPGKLDLNRRYAERSGLITDLAVIVVTLYAVILRRVPVGFMTRLVGAPPPVCLVGRRPQP